MVDLQEKQVEQEFFQRNLKKEISPLPALSNQTDAACSIIKKFQYEIMSCVKCPVVLECSYSHKRLQNLQNEAKAISEQIYSEELELDHSAENTLRAQNRRNLTFKAYLRDNSFRVLQNDRCIWEKNEIVNLLQKFVDAGYLISEPRVFLIIQELISNLLNSGRANKHFTNLGLMLQKETAGGTVYYRNPLIDSKIEFSRLIVESIESLDRILKTDVKEIKVNSFTEHLLKELKIRDKKNAEHSLSEIALSDEADEHFYDIPLHKKV